MCAAGGLHDDPPTSAAPHRPAQQPTTPVRDDPETARLPSVPATDSTSNKNSEQIESVAIRFAGDSGDGMQLTGTKFTDETALAGNDLSTFPDFPAEIRAPAGTMAGVSGFQIHFSSRDVHTPADRPDVLIAFNPAALRANVEDVRPGGTVIINIDSFNEKSLKRAGYDGGEPDAVRYLPGIGPKYPSWTYLQHVHFHRLKFLLPKEKRERIKDELEAYKDAPFPPSDDAN